MMNKQGVRNFVFDIHDIIDDQADEDIWIIYQRQKDLERYQSLHSLLWNITFDPQ